MPLGDKIVLTLVLQAHPSRDKSAEINNEVVYSQLRVMQVLQSYPHAAIVGEHLVQEASSQDRIGGEDLAFLKELFPQYQHLNRLSFNQLNQFQKMLLNKKEGIDILFHLGLIPHIYPGSSRQLDGDKLLAKYKKSYFECLEKFPILGAKRAVRLRDLGSPRELQAYQDFAQMVRENNPEIFEYREKDALDSVLRAANQSGKDQVVLVFGKDHARGFVELIKTTYKERIHLKLCIDSTAGFIDASPKKKPVPKQSDLTNPSYSEAVKRLHLISIFRAQGYEFVYEGNVSEALSRNLSHFG